MEKNILRIATYNIRNTADHYVKRIPLLKETFEEINPNIIGFQEVSFKYYNQINDIINDKPYCHYVAESQLPLKLVNGVKDEDFNIDGISILVDKELLENSNSFSHNILHLSSIRVAQMFSFNFKNLRINLSNLHLHHIPEEENIRLHQMWNVLRWIDMNTDTNDFNIILGDFNSEPGSLTYNQIIENGYKSSHYQLYNREPELTFHNRMNAPFKDDSPNGTFDYIFIKSNINYEIKSVTLHGQKESNHDEGIFASDHFALVTEICFS